MAALSEAAKLRYKRFVEQSTIYIGHKETDSPLLKCYYDGPFVTDRMTRIRPAIYQIRQNWASKYDTFVEEAQSVLRNFRENHSATDLWEEVLGIPRNWCDISDVSSRNFKVLELYTKQDGYDAIFKAINNIFRKDSSDKEIRAAVFIVELINIDLFNYVHANPMKFNNFEGVVYRGFAVTEDELSSFKNIMTRPVANRYISVPLSLQSSSKSEQTGLLFAKDTCDNERKRHRNLVALLLRIHVIGLPEKRLHEYTVRFPNSVISTICAVDIKQLSTDPTEEEVLLRGAFYQVIGITEKRYGNEVVTVIDGVMLNTNRDHLSNAFLGADDDMARKLIGTLVGVTRNEYVIKYLESTGTTEGDADYQIYRNELEAGQKKLEDLLNEIQPKRL